MILVSLSGFDQVEGPGVCDSLECLGYTET